MANKRGGAFGRLLDPSKVAAQYLVRADLCADQTGVSQDWSQQIVEIVGNATGELTTASIFWAWTS